jgi:uncharacterized protein YlxP (DUF503 family)
MVVGCVELTLTLLASASLKDKRSVVRRTIDRVQHRFHVSIAEVGLNDAPDRALIGIAAVANDATFVRSILDKIVDFIDDDLLGRAEVTDTRMELVHL